MVFLRMATPCPFLLLLLTPYPVLSEPSDPLELVFASIKAGDLPAQVKSVLDKNRASLLDFINQQDPGSGQTPLMMAVLMGREGVVEVLLAEPAVDASIPEKDGYTPLHGAGFQGRARIASMLLRDHRKLDPNHRYRIDRID